MRVKSSKTSGLSSLIASVSQVSRLVPPRALDVEPDDMILLLFDELFELLRLLLAVAKSCDVGGGLNFKIVEDTVAVSSISFGFQIQYVFWWA